MYSGWGKSREKEPITKYLRHMGISAILIAAVLLILLIVIIWWFYGYSFVIAPTKETVFRAINSTAGV